MYAKERGGWRRKKEEGGVEGGEMLGVGKKEMEKEKDGEGRRWRRKKMEKEGDGK